MQRENYEILLPHCLLKISVKSTFAKELEL